MVSFVARIDEPEQPQPPHGTWPQTVWGLEIVRGQARQMFRPINGPVFMIGTAVDCDLVLADDAFPETYLYLYIKHDVVSVRRFGVGPQLYIDDVETDVAELPIGSVLRFGSYAFRLTQQTGGGPGPGDEPGPDKNDFEPADDDSFLPADFSAWEINESAAVDKVRALLAAVRASLRGEKKQPPLRVYAGAAMQKFTQPQRRQSA